MSGEKGWLMKEFARASARSKALPRWARPVVVREYLQTDEPLAERGLLTDDEHRVVQLLAEAFNLWAASGSGGNDLLEFATAIHHAQHQVMAQAAARAYPDLYRRAEGTPR